MMQLFIIILLVLSSYCLAKPNGGLIIKIDVDVQSDDGQHGHKSVELVKDEIVDRDEHKDGDGGDWRSLIKSKKLGKIHKEIRIIAQ